MDCRALARRRGSAHLGPQTASVGVSTTGQVRQEGNIIRFNLSWTFALLGYVLLVALLFSVFLPDVLRV